MASRTEYALAPGAVSDRGPRIAVTLRRWGRRVRVEEGGVKEV